MGPDGAECIEPESTNPYISKSDAQLDDEYFFNRTVFTEDESEYYPCDKKSNLYLLQQEQFLDESPPPFEGNITESDRLRYIYWAGTY